jgi:hypothetical protein
MPSADLATILRHLQDTAAAQVKPSRVGTGRFTSHKLVKLKSEIKTKAGLAFTRGEYAIGTQDRDELPGLPSSGRFVVIWSRRVREEIKVIATEVEWL